MSGYTLLLSVSFCLSINRNCLILFRGKVRHIPERIKKFEDGLHELKVQPLEFVVEEEHFGELSKDGIRGCLRLVEHHLLVVSGTIEFLE